GRGWYVNRADQTMVLVPPPAALPRGDQQGARGQANDRRFAIAAKEVTLGEFLKWKKNHLMRDGQTINHPVRDVPFYEAAEYCNKLSELDGIPKGQWCYLPNEAGKFDKGMRVADNYLSLRGYRLPTQSEWDVACRAGTVTGWSCGDVED